MKNFDIYDKRLKNVIDNIVFLYVTIIIGWIGFLFGLGIATGGTITNVLAVLIAVPVVFIAVSMYFVSHIIGEVINMTKELQEGTKEKQTEE